MEPNATSNGAFNLRDYQSECLAAIKTRYLAGIRRQLTCLPTGSGKTVIFAEFPRYFRMKKQMLVLAHRAELLDQARDKIRRANPDLRVEVEQAGRSAGPDSHVVVASVPTLGRKASKRLNRLDPDRFFLIVVAPTILGDCEVLLGRRGREIVLVRGQDIEETILQAETHVRENLPECVALVTRDTRWRYDPATKKQINVLRAKKLDVPKGLTKGQAGHLISMVS